MEITRRLEFDSGHRVPSHNSLCRNFHGHRYRLEVTVSGEVKSVREESDDGMVLDFGDIKTIMNEAVVSKWDHAFLVYCGDKTGVRALQVLGDQHRTVLLDVVPTAEELVKLAAEAVRQPLESLGLSLTRVRLYETPNSWGDWVAPSLGRRVGT